MFEIITDSDTPMTKDDLYNFLVNNGFDGTSPYYRYKCNGYANNTVLWGALAYASGGTIKTISFSNSYNGSYNAQLSQISASYFIDKVIAL